jgi:6-phosphogluconolactonase (cycloisomerase 2 family)
MHLNTGPNFSPLGRVAAALTMAVVAIFALFEIAMVGAADPILTFVEFQKDGVNGVDGLFGVHDVVVSPDGKHLYSVSLVDDAIAVFSRNSTTGVLTFVEFQKDGVDGVDGLNGGISLTISPDGNNIYATGVTDDAVAVFSRNITTGVLTFVEAHKDGLNGVDELDGAISVTVSSDGKNIYVAAPIDDAVTVFSRNPTTGALTFLESLKDGVNGIDGLDGVSSVTVSPDGNHLYSVAITGDSVAVFNRNPTTGSLTFVEAHKDDTNGVDGLNFARSVTASPDGKHIYVAGLLDDAVAVFKS